MDEKENRTQHGRSKATSCAKGRHPVKYERHGGLMEKKALQASSQVLHLVGMGPVEATVSIIPFILGKGRQSTKGRSTGSQGR